MYSNPHILDIIFLLCDLWRDFGCQEPGPTVAMSQEISKYNCFGEHVEFSESSWCEGKYVKGGARFLIML